MRSTAAAFVLATALALVGCGGLLAPRTEHATQRVLARGHALVLADGAAFRALGENRINVYDPEWNWNRLGPEEYVAYMAANGMNVLRVFVVSDVENEATRGPNRGVLEPELGRFDEGVAREFDAIFRAAERHGVRVILVAFALGWSENDDWKSWHDNPYSAARGGPAPTRYDFFESPIARARAADRIRWLARRYAASPAFLAIDLLNEPEWDGEIPEVSWGPWAREMARAWRDADPYGRLVTVGSVGLHWNVEGDEHDWWASPECDLVQWHLYGKEVYDVHALADTIARKVRETWRHGKPILLGEFAWGEEPKPDHDHTHVGIWAATFAGAGVLAHSAPPFTPDSDEPMTPERALHFRTLARFLRGLPVLEPGDASATHGVVARQLRSEGAIALWLLAPRSGYGATLTDARVRVALGSGAWRVTWVDDVSGTTLATSTLAAPGGEVDFSVPPFARHVAARLERVR